ncbi:4018_t:CDS:2, partial [Racocetra persica]
LLQQADVEYKSDEIVKVEICCIRSKQYNTIALGLDEKETTIGKQFLENLNALLWELDEHHEKLKNQRSESWNEFVEEVFKLILCIQKYIKYLESINESVNTIHNTMQLA